MIKSFTTTLQRYPSRFWVLAGSSFIDRLGSTMVIPFFSLYITQKFNVGMTQAGVMLGLFSIAGFVGGMIGGALTDRFGRRIIIISGLIFSAVSSIAFGLVNDFTVFYIIAVVVGLPSNMSHPAFEAMVADILPEDQLAEGYGMIRVINNLSWVIGPMIGGLLISYSYLYIFIGDAIASVIVAGIYFRVMPETKPERDSGTDPEPVSDTFLGYLKVAKDGLFLTFTLAMIICIFPYQQIYSTLSVFLRDVHGLPESGFGSLVTANAVLVVLTQFWVSTQVGKRKPMLMLALASFFFMVGLVMYGLVSTYALFMVAMLLITVGEMVMMPVSQALVAKFAPEQMRGRYMAFFSLSWLVPAIFGPGAGGLILDNYNPNLVWYLCGVFCLVAIGMFLFLGQRIETRAGEPAPETV